MTKISNTVFNNNNLTIEIQENLPAFINKYIENKKKHLQATRKYALNDPARTRAYANAYYNKNKDDPAFKQKVRERALKYYYEKKCKTQSPSQHEE